MPVDTVTRSRRTVNMALIGAAAIALSTAILLLRGTSLAIVQKWSDWAAFNHGFLIIPISMYLAWRVRRQAAGSRINADFRALGLVAAAAFGWLLGQATGTMIIQELSLVAVAQAIVLTMYGWPVWRVFAFPLLYLYFAVPFGQALVPRLQVITAALSVWLLEHVGIPVFSDGNIISVPNGTFYVADACSGIGFLVASLAVGALFAGITYRSWWRRAAFMVLSIVIPIVGNGVRAFGIILLAYLTNNELAAGVDHILYGWIFFSLLTIATLAIGMSFREEDEAIPCSAQQFPRIDHTPALSRVLVAGTIALALVATAASYGSYLDRRPVAAAIQLVAPPAFGPWHESSGPLDSLAPVFAAPDAQLDAGYQKSNDTVHLHIGYYVRNRQGAQAVSSDHQFSHGKDWIMSAEGTINTLIGAAPLTVQYMRSRNRQQSHMTWYWYWIDGQFTGNPYWAKLLEARSRLFGGRDDAAIIAIGADYDENSADAIRILADFASHLGALDRIFDVPQSD